MRTLRFTCLIACCLIASFVQAQGFHPPTTLTGHFGLKFGAQITKTAIQGTTPISAKNSTQFNLGVMYRLRYHKYVVQPELIYNVKGGTFQIEQTGSTPTTINNNYNYLSLPVMFGYIPTEGITLQVGPEFSYALNTPASNGPAVHNDLGLAIGVHYDFLDMLSKLSLQARYIYGFTDIAPDTQASYYNRAFQLSLVYNFYKKEK